jgi:hypothetical protein
MRNGPARLAIDQEPRGRRCPYSRYPISPMSSKTKEGHNIQKIAPVDGIECFRDVKLQEKRWHFFVVEVFDNLMNKHKVMVKISLLNESALVAGNQVLQFRGKPIC